MSYQTNLKSVAKRHVEEENWITTSISLYNENRLSSLEIIMSLKISHEYLFSFCKIINYIGVATF